jgi:hypothetical protein
MRAHNDIQNPRRSPGDLLPIPEHALLKYLLPCLLCFGLASAHAAQDRDYLVRFSGTFIPERGVVEASIRITQSHPEVRELDMAAPASRFAKFSGDGELARNGQRLVWTVPREGGTVSYEVKVDHKRGERYDARMTEDWAILRMDDLFPAARVRSLKGAVSISRLELRGPPGWAFESRYGPVSDSRRVESAERRYHRPTGWLVAGKLGIRRESISGRYVTVAAPQNQGMRRLEMIAFMNWTLPTLVQVFPAFPHRFLIVGARDDMWRGGLSGPGSVYLHSDRALISENATSALMHELVHAATGQAKGPREDWIIEGLAEYYSLEVLRRSGGLSNKRAEQAIAWLAGWAERDNGRLLSPSSGPNTARAVGIFVLIQEELSANQAGSVDSVVRKLLASPVINGEQLLKLTEAALGESSPKLSRALARYSGPAP